MAEQTREEWLGDVLNNEIPVIPELADLPSLWRETPTEGFDLNRPGDLTRLEWLAGYIYLADTEPWARDGLRRLLRELLENGEPVPALLGVWPSSNMPRATLPRSAAGRKIRSETSEFWRFTRCCGLTNILVKRLWALSQTGCSTLRKPSGPSFARTSIRDTSHSGNNSGYLFTLTAH